MPVFEAISNFQYLLAECPVWDHQKNELWWTDILGAAVYRYRFEGRKLEKLIQGKNVGGFAMNRAGGLVCACFDGLYLWHLQGGFTLIASTFAGKNLRFNDAIADASGRFLAGTRYLPYGRDGDYELGSLYRVDHDASISVLEEGIHLSNGMGFSPDNTTMYHSDSILHTIYKYDYDLKGGELSNRRVFAEVPSEQGMPDGLTVDRDGYVWSAHWLGSRITRYRPDGRVDRTIECPFRKPTSLVFGGSRWRDLYITSASDNDEAPRAVRYSTVGGVPNTGGLVYRYRLDVTGKPEHSADIAI